MATEVEELRLVITLTDNASAGLKSILQYQTQLGSGASQAHIERFKRGHNELAKQIKEMSELVTGGEKAMLAFIGKFGVAGAAFAALGAVVYEGVRGLNEFSNKITEINNKSKVFGVHPAVLKSIEEQLARINVSADVADASVAGFNEAYAKMGRIGSKEHLALLDAAGKNRNAMEKSIQSVLANRDTVKGMNEVMTQSQVIFNNRMKETNNNLADATEFTKRFLATWGITPEFALIKHLEGVSEEEKKRMDDQIKATAQYEKQITILKQEWDSWMDDIKTSALSPDGIIVQGLTLAISLTKTLHELWNKPLTGQVAGAVGGAALNMLPPVVAGRAAYDFYQWLNSHPTDQIKVPPPAAPPQKEGIGEQLGLANLPNVPGITGKVTPLLSSMSEDADKHHNEMKDNTDQLKRLNDYLAVQQLGGAPPGSGVGGGAAPGGAAAPSGPAAAPGPTAGPTATTPSAPSTNGMGSVDSPGLDPFTKGTKSMGSIGAGSPEAAAAAMAGSGQTSAAAAGGGGGGGGGGGVPPELSKWITQKENFSKTAFSDYGQTNIGYGTSARGRTSISEPEAFAEMNEKLSGSLDRIDKLNPKLTKGQRIALASLDFNTGWTTRGGEKNDAMRKAIREGDVAGARQLFLTYSHVGGPHGQVLPGLLKRREQEVPGFDDPNYFGGKRGTSAAEDFGGKMDPAAARRMQDRQIVDRRSIKTVKVDATGKVAVKIGGGSDATLDSQGLFKPTTLERRTQMTPATTGPKADAPASFREKLEAIP